MPSCADFLCSKMDTEDYGANVPENADLQSNKVHSCYPSSLTLGLFFSQNCGIPIEREATFNCNLKRVLDPEERLHKVDEIFRYKTLEQALVRLRSHPVGATLVLFDDWFEPEIYRGPLKQGAKLVALNEVVMIDCREIEWEMVVSCKSNGKDTR